jgi:leucyl/phenylalanyl-tRNA--protein transferase
MPIYRLTEELRFPPPEGASPEGIVAIGGDFRAERMLLGYAQGIFPWPSEGLPLLWFSPDPRFVLPLSQVHLPKSLRKRMRREPFEIRFDTAFEAVIEQCAVSDRPGQRGTWITPELIDGYVGLHRRGFAHSIEAWAGSQLVGGLYGVSLGGVFFGESMFALAPDASKCAFATLLAHLKRWEFALVDCQVHTEHLERFGAADMPRSLFLHTLRHALLSHTRLGPWHTELDTRAVLDTFSGEDADSQ